MSPQKQHLMLIQRSIALRREFEALCDQLSMQSWERLLRSRRLLDETADMVDPLKLRLHSSGDPAE